MQQNFEITHVGEVRDIVFDIPPEMQDLASDAKILITGVDAVFTKEIRALLQEEILRYFAEAEEPLLGLLVIHHGALSWYDRESFFR